MRCGGYAAKIGRGEGDKRDQPEQRTGGPVPVADAGVLQVSPGLGAGAKSPAAAALLGQQDRPGLLVVPERAVVGSELLVWLGLVAILIPSQDLQTLRGGQVRLQGCIGQPVDMKPARQTRGRGAELAGRCTPQVHHGACERRVCKLELAADAGPGKIDLSAGGEAAGE